MNNKDKFNTSICDCQAKIDNISQIDNISRGNRCGHDRKSLRFYVKPQHQKRRFHVLEEAIRRVKDAIENPFDYPMFHGLMFHGNGRSIRSERLEAELTLLIPVLIDTVNLASMQIGHYLPTGDFNHYAYDLLVERTGMSYWRVERNIQHLKRAGLVDVKIIIYQTNDGYRTERVIITLSASLFEMLHLDTQLLVDREKAARNRQKLINKVDARKKYLELYRPRSFNNKTRNADKPRENSYQSLAAIKRPNYNPSYNPACDKQVIAVAAELLKNKSCATMREAIHAACIKLGKHPPS